MNEIFPSTKSFSFNQKIAQKQSTQMLKEKMRPRRSQVTPPFLHIHSFSLSALSYLCVCALCRTHPKLACFYSFSPVSNWIESQLLNMKEFSICDEPKWKKGNCLPRTSHILRRCRFARAEIDDAHIAYTLTATLLTHSPGKTKRSSACNFQTK